MCNYVENVLWRLYGSSGKRVPDSVPSGLQIQWESVPVTEVTGFTTQPLRGFRFPGGERYYSRWFQPPVVPTEDLRPEGTPSKKI
jgi:hypothetical protein